MRTAILMLVATACAAPAAYAHQSAQSRMEVHVRPDDGEIDLLLAIPTKDLGVHLQLDRNADDRVDAAEFEAGRSHALTYLRRTVGARAGGTRCTPKGPGMLKFTPGGSHVAYLETYRCELRGVVELHNLALFETGRYTHLARIQIGKAIHTTAFTAGTPAWEIEIGEPVSRVDTVSRFVGLGIWHILSGVDHVLFVICLLLVAPTLRRLLGVVTAFTAAHTLTLVASALDWFTLPPGAVEPAIAASIVFVAVENVVTTRGERGGPRRRHWVTFAFGLLHGFGFSYVLRDQVGLPTEALVPALVSFNVGVELGQVAIVLVVWPLIRLGARWTHWRWGVWGLSGAVGTLALYWFVQRVLVALAQG